MSYTFQALQTMTSFAPKPTNISSDGKTGTCPGGFVFQPSTWSYVPDVPSNSPLPATCVSASTMWSTARSSGGSCPKGWNTTSRGGLTGRLCPPGSQQVGNCCSPSVAQSVQPIPQPTAGTCPSGYEYKPAGCRNTDGSFSTDPNTPGKCSRIRQPGDLPDSLGPAQGVTFIPSCPTEPTNFFWSKNSCPQGYLKIDAGTKNEGCRAAELITPLPLVEVKSGEGTTTTPDWLVANWKWCVVIAAVGGVTYWWAKRKPVTA